MATKMNSLEDLYVNQLQDLYSAEQQLVEALPKMAKAATSSELKQGFENHLDQTRNHVTRLEEIFSNVHGEKNGNICEGMQGLIREGEEAINVQGNEAVRDAALIAAAQRVEHYEIAGYGTVKTFAERLGDRKAADLLDQTLKEEYKVNDKLTSIAESQVNRRAEK